MTAILSALNGIIKGIGKGIGIVNKFKRGKEIFTLAVLFKKSTRIQKVSVKITFIFGRRFHTGY